MPPSLSFSSTLGLGDIDDQKGALDGLVNWSASDPRPVFWSLSGQHDLPDSLRDAAMP
jgi:hypothetical protein